ncbi:calcium/sodium antiporter [Bowmanella pacifica]|uniref:Sodium:calcium antiporter n=1 Tax=Bowmanella pacifica TaxID=502051 RepID=A0A917YXW8_9ALTE|nr:calcium/sodium antiporter [Bowmanella pacifica]GGO68976.1 sodium:calcium antiporter [Bowmanella pacifica]
MITQCLIFLAGLIVLSWSADRFIQGASAISGYFGVPPLFIGLTIVAMGSSAPEIMVSISAALAGNRDTAVGNAIGSNIANIGLVLGAVALLKPLQVASGTLRREMPMVLLVSLLAAYLMWDGRLGHREGLLLLVLFFLVIGLLAWLALRSEKSDPLSKELRAELPNIPVTKALLWLLMGMLLLPLSAHMMVDSATHIARYFGISDLVIGLTIVAIGTSLPELAASISGILKKEDDLALGNILGSNIFNILAVLSVPGLLAPGNIDPQAMQRDMPVMLVLTLLLILFCFAIKERRRIERWQGGLLLACYLAYQTSLFQP